MFIENAKEDFQGTDPTHLVINEVKKVTTDRTSRLVIPAYGAFFVKSLQVRDLNTKLPLTLGRDYTIDVLDERATLRSGKEVAADFVITNVNITGIEYSYRFVGGLHSNGKYLMDIIQKQYPNGIDANKHWDNIKGKPDTFKPKPHTHSAHDTYGYDGVNAQLRRVRKGIETGAENSIANIYVRADQKLTELEVKTNEELNEIREHLQSVFESLRVQQGEYIFTDSLDNPSILRGYGTWQRITNTVLRGAETDLVVGNGTILSTGTRQALRNVYVWLNKDTGTAPSYTLAVENKWIVANVINIPEETQLDIQLHTSNVAEGTEIDWIIDGISEEFIDETLSKRFGKFKVDNLGRAYQSVRFKNDPNKLGDRTCTFMLEHIMGVKYAIKILDTVRSKWTEMYFSHDAAGLLRATRIAEGSMAYLQLRFHGYEVGETVYLDWSTSTIPSYDFEIQPPSFISATSGNLTLQLKVKANELTDGERTLVVYAKQTPEEVISNEHTMAYALIDDTSTGKNIQIDFINSAEKIVTNVGEGETFDISLKTNLIQGAVVDLVYESTKGLNEFGGLQPQVTIDANGMARFSVTTNIDYLTNEGVQLLKVSALINNKTYADNTMILRDTSQTPQYTMFITKENSSTPIDKINEGEAFWIHVKVPTWVDTPNPPKLSFSYGLNGDYSPNSGVTTRVSGSYHNQLEFGSSSDVYDDVIWRTGELIIKMTAIADRKFGGNKPFNVAMKQGNMDTALLQTSVMIMDTSVLEMTSAWSSSAVILNPITQVNEMQSDGTNNTCYLWLDVDGDGSLFGDITIQAAGNVTPTLDLVTVFPALTRFGTGKTRHIFAVTIAADFLNEGNEQLICFGTYVNANGVTTEIFRNSITIIDNSIQIPLDVKISTSPTDPDAAAPNGKYSEYSNIYAHISFPAYALATNIEWQVTSGTGGSAVGQFMSLSGTISVASGVPGVVATLQPVADRTQDGEFAALFKSKRVLQSNSKVIGTGPDKPFTLLDDSLPLTVDTKFYKDAARTIETYIFNEGDTVYGRTKVSNPGGNFYLMNNIVRPITADDGTYIQLGVDSDVVKHPDQRKVRQVYSLQNSNVTYTDDFQFTLNRNRKTAIKPQVLEFGGIVVQNDSPRYNVGDTTTLNWNTSLPQSKKTITVNDVSKTAIYGADVGLTVAGPRVTSVDEGVSFFLSLNITEGEVGDVFTVTKRNSFDAGRLEVNQLGVEQIQSLKNDKISWQFRVKLDRNTNTNNTIEFGVINKTTGATVAIVTLPINDIYQTPTLTVKYYLLYNGTYYTPNPIGERIPTGGQQYMMVVGDQYLLSDETIKISYLSGRPTNKWTPETNWNKEFPVITLSGSLVPPEYQGKKGVIIPISPLQDKTTNPAGELTIVGRASTSITNATTDFNYGIRDDSRTRSFVSVSWHNPSNGAGISSIDEGQTAELRVVVNGGDEEIDVKVDNNGGRSPSRLDSNEYGVTKTRTADGEVLKWQFRVSLDNMDNTGAEAKLAVRVSVPDTAGLIRDIELPINDVSRSVTGSIEFHAANSTDVISVLPEGNGFGPAYILTKPNMSSQFRLLTKSERSGTEWKFDQVLTASQFTSLGNDIYRYKPQLSVALDSKTNPPNQLYITAELWDVSRNLLLASNQLTIIDVSREQIDASNIRITNPTDGAHTHLTSINEGSTARIWFAPVCFAGTNWNQRAFWWEATGEDFTPKGGYFWQKDILPDGSYAIDVQIPADETTNGNRDIQIRLFEVYDDIGGQWSFRGISNPTTILDTSPRPAIRAVFFSGESVVGANTGALSEINEGQTMYLHVWATGLTPDGSDTTVSIEYIGEATQADFDTPLPTNITMRLFDASIREYKGVSGPLTIKNDNIEG